MLESDIPQIMMTIITIVKPVMKKNNTILVICYKKKLFQAWTDARSQSELALFHSLKWQLAITTKYKCFILERALVERLKAILRKLLSLKSFGMECEVRARCFVVKCSLAFQEPGKWGWGGVGWGYSL